MAATIAALPTVISAGVSIWKLIAGLVHKQAPVAEQNLGAGTGPAKLEAVFSVVVQVLQQMAAAGAINKSLPSDEAIKAAISAVVESMKATGVLGPAAASNTATPPTVPPGTILRVQVLPCSQCRGTCKSAGGTEAEVVHG